MQSNKLYEKVKWLCHQNKNIILVVIITVTVDVYTGIW